jgi:hypothetical protein
MARNRNAGKHPSYLKLNWSPSSIARKRAYDKKYNSSKEKINYRAELNQANRDVGTYGNGDGKDMSHTKNGKMVKEHQSKNRGRNGQNGKSTKK